MSMPVLIQFDLSKVPIGKIIHIEELLREVGITFDTGTGFGCRDWQWDWSLKGPVEVSYVET